MIIDTAFLSRIQFGFTISFHILFPAFSIGLALFIAIMEGVWLKTHNPLYLSICKFWTKVFALTFGMGVVSGIVMEFQLGTNWAGFAKSIGGVLGPLFTYEVMTAFFIEAGFLGVMLFGWNRVGPKLHYLATLLVVIGTTLSAYWIMSANTWMQHPIGFILENGSFKVENWWEIVFNPMTFPRFMHMLLASYISAAFVISSVSAYYLLQKRFVSFSRKSLNFIWLSLIFLIPAQIYFGDLAGTNIYKMQPLKTAAIEGVWETEKGAPLIIFGIPNQEKQKNEWTLSIPHVAALINTHHWDGELIGLKTVSTEDQPWVWPVFYSFRIMVAIGFFMLFLVLVSLYLRIKKRLFTSPLFLKIAVISAPLGFIALWCGWIMTEIGRQPWVVYNLIRTVDAVSNISLKDVMISFILIFIVYGIIFGYFYFYFLHKTITKGPIDIKEDEPHQPFQYMPTPFSEP